MALCSQYPSWSFLLKSVQIVCHHFIQLFWSIMDVFTFIVTQLLKALDMSYIWFPSGGLCTLLSGMKPFCYVWLGGRKHHPLWSSIYKDACLFPQLSSRAFSPSESSFPFHICPVWALWSKFYLMKLPLFLPKHVAFSKVSVILPCSHCDRKTET